MNAKHTSGAWQVKEGYDKDSGLKLHRVVFGTSIVAECYGVNSNDNARLIAASPELLVLLESIINSADKNGVSSLYENRECNPHKTVCAFGEALAAARAAIAKAVVGAA